MVLRVVILDGSLISWKASLNFLQRTCSPRLRPRVAQRKTRSSGSSVLWFSHRWVETCNSLISWFIYRVSCAISSRSTRQKTTTDLIETKSWAWLFLWKTRSSIFLSLVSLSSLILTYKVCRRLISLAAKRMMFQCLEIQREAIKKYSPDIVVGSLPSSFVFYSYCCCWWQCADDRRKTTNLLLLLLLITSPSAILLL